MVFNTT